MLISCFMSILLYKMNLIKIKGINIIFSTSVQYKCCHGNTVDDILIKATANNDR